MNRAQKISLQRTNALIVLFVLMVLPLAYFLNIWSDEASTLYSTQNGLSDALRHAANNEKQAPLYFWFLSVWRMLSGSIFFARLFSVLCAAAAIRVFASVSSRLFEARPAMLAAAFFAFNPFLIWASLEIRVYALVILISVVLIRLFIETFWDEALNDRRTRIAFFVVSLIALYTNYYLAFVLAGLFAALVISRKWKAAANYLMAAVPAFVLFAPWLLEVRAQLAANTAGYQEARSLIDALQKLWRHALTFMLPAGVFPDGDGSAVLMARLWIVRIALLAVAVGIVLRRGRMTALTVVLFAAVSTIFLCLLGSYFLLGPVYVELRHAAVLFVPLVLLAVSVLTDLFEKPAPQWLLLPAALVVLMSFAYSVSILYPGMTKRGDWARVGEFIEQHESAGQPVVVFTTFDALALPYHYHGRNQVLPDQRFFDFEQEAQFGSVDSLRKQTDFVISQIPPDSEEIWLAVNEKCTTTNACIPLQNFVAANYTIEIEQDFYLEKVFLLRKKH